MHKLQVLTIENLLLIILPPRFKKIHLFLLQNTTLYYCYCCMKIH
jgi:hypothetical protein